jgi:NAD(P)-dependent dehydrogenase (short-subunit alcohol dehydrogenase family)
MQLNERTAVITGAASGIGLAMTERFLTEGMNVVMADIEEALLAERCSALADNGASVSSIACDVSDASQVAALRDAALEKFGAVHLLCNNAGVASGSQLIRERPEVLDWVVGVNVLGVGYGVSAFAPLMVEQGEGHIVNTASEAGLVATGMLGSYHATKYAVVGLSEALSLELQGTGVGVSCLCPELVDTMIFESTRNAPSGLGLGQPAHLPISTIESWIGTVAMDPSDVAGRVAYAVKANRFWIITHQVTEARILQRNRDLEAGRLPRNPVGPSGL